MHIVVFCMYSMRADKLSANTFLHLPRNWKCMRVWSCDCQVCLLTFHLHLCTRGTSHFVSYGFEVDASHQIHFPWMNLQDIKPWRFIGVWKFNFPIYSARTKQGGIQNVNPVCGHQDLHDSQLRWILALVNWAKERILSPSDSADHKLS